VEGMRRGQLLLVSVWIGVLGTLETEVRSSEIAVDGYSGPSSSSTSHFIHHTILRALHTSSDVHAVAVFGQLR
jgi:hypothetical protein